MSGNGAAANRLRRLAVLAARERERRSRDAMGGLPSGLGLLAGAALAVCVWVAARGRAR